jgi:hypothetical protein
MFEKEAQELFEKIKIGWISSVTELDNEMEIIVKRVKK